MTKPSHRIIDAFGGIRPMSRALGHKSASTVQYWADTGFIPRRREQEVLDAARREGIALDRADFVAAEAGDGSDAPQHQPTTFEPLSAEAGFADSH